MLQAYTNQIDVRLAGICLTYKKIAFIQFVLVILGLILAGAKIFETCAMYDQRLITLDKIQATIYFIKKVVYIEFQF